MVLSCLVDLMIVSSKERKMNSVGQFLNIRTAAFNWAYNAGVIENLGLKTQWEIIQNTNTSGDAKNYHSNDHMEQVFIIAQWLLITNGVKSNKTFALACLMHDYDHTVGKESDVVNIQNALNGVDDLLTNKYHGYILVEIKRLIKITQYPFLLENTPTTIFEAALRDADLMYAMTDDKIKRLEILRKLSVEIHGHADFTDDELFYQQQKFWSTAQMYTDQGREVLSWFIEHEGI